MSKQPMADRVAAHNAGQYDAELAGTPYSGALKLWELVPATFTTDEELEATDALLGDAKKLAAQVSILSDMLGECAELLKGAYDEIPYAANFTGEPVNKHVHLMIEKTLANTKLVREMK